VYGVYRDKKSRFGLSSVTAFGSLKVKGGSNIGLGKVIAFVEQGAIRASCQGVSEAIAKIETCGMTALAIVQVGLTGDLGLFSGDRGNLNSRLGEQGVELPAGSRSELFVDHNTSFEKVGRRHCLLICGRNRIREASRVVLIEQDRQHGGGVDDHRGSPDSS